jgi:hypothetical protein
MTRRSISLSVETYERIKRIAGPVSLSRWLTDRIEEWTPANDHIHAFQLIDPLHNRYRCDCGVYGARKGGRVNPVACQYEFDDRKHCGAPSVQVGGERSLNRCEEHKR